LTGYSKPVIVHAKYKAEWQLSEDLPQPKQWIDINGEVVDVALQRCRRAVYGLLVQKPGINEVSFAVSISIFLTDRLQHDLRATLSATFNRQEVNDLLQQLMKQGRISRVVPKRIVFSERYLDLYDVKYEPLISYLPEALW
jgi:hypothetical protein